MKNTKYFVSIMIAVLAVVWVVLRTGENLGSDFEKARFKDNSDMGLNMKSNTFRFTNKPPAPPAAPKWGSFKSEPVAPKTPEQVAFDKNQEVLKAIAKKVSDKMKDDKKKQKKVAKTKKKQGVTLIKTAADSRVNRAMRRLDDGFSPKQPVQPIAFARPPVNQASPQSAGAEGEGEDVRTFEEWQDAVVRKANPEETENLINQYAQNRLGEPSWIFILAEQMLQSDSEDVQKEGMKVYAKIPASEQSFTALSKNDDQHTETINVQIKKELTRYVLYQNLGILEKSVRSTVPVVQIHAAQTIDLSAQAKLAEPTTPQAGRGQRSDTTTSAAADNTVHLRYQVTLGVLRSANERSKSPEGKAAIQTTITSLEGMLSGTPNPQVEIATQW